MVKTITDRAARILKKIEDQDRKNQKRWRSYTGPADWSFAVLNAPKKEPEERKNESPEVSNG